MNEKPERLAVLAIDPKHGQAASFKDAIKSARTISDAFQMSLIVAGVLSKDQFPWPQGFDDSIKNAVEKAAENTLAEIVESAGVELKSEIVCEEGHSNRDAAGTLAKFAEEKDARTVFLPTHMSGHSHVFGGFAHAFLKACDLPILMINVNVPPVQKVKKILFATDFSDTELKAFDEAIEFSKSAGAELILVKCLVAPFYLEAAANAGMVSVWPAFEEWMGEEAEASFKNANGWCERGLKAGASVQFQLVNGFLSVREGVLHFADEIDADLIMVVGRHNYGVTTNFFSSVVFEIVARAARPVMVLRKSSFAARFPKGVQ